MFEFNERGVKLFCRGEPDLGVCKEVLIKQTYQKPKLGFLVNPGSTWVDIGANIGAFSVWASTKRAGKVIAFEPMEDNHSLAVVNMKQNMVSGVCYKKAVGDNSGVVEIAYNTKTPARSSSLSSSGSSEQCEQVSFNDVVDEYKPEGIKMDAEGAELAILDKGLNLSGVQYLVLEYHARFDKSIKNAIERLKPVASSFKYSRIPKQLISGSGEYPSWVDPICFFWN